MAGTGSLPEGGGRGNDGPLKKEEEKEEGEIEEKGEEKGRKAHRFSRSGSTRTNQSALSFLSFFLR